MDEVSNSMVTLSFSNDIKVSYGDLIFNCYIYAGKRLDEIKRQIEKGLRELLEDDASEGHIGGIRHVITSKDPDSREKWLTWVQWAQALGGKSQKQSMRTV